MPPPASCGRGSSPGLSQILGRSSLSFQTIPVSMMATATSGRPVVVSTRRPPTRPGSGPSGLRPGERVLAAQPLRVRVERVVVERRELASRRARSRSARTAGRRRSRRSGARPRRRRSQWSKSGSFGALSRTLSFGSLPGKAASATAGSAKARPRAGTANLPPRPATRRGTLLRWRYRRDRRAVTFSFVRPLV